jgi:hypothetical protein
MLAPQFSLRRLLLWVTFSAFLCLIAAAAARGQAWAVGVLVAVVGLVILLVVCAALYGVVKLMSGLLDRIQGSRGKLAPPAPHGSWGAPQADS